MSEAINKVLASTSQSFTTAEQAQARANIGAAAASSVGLSGVYHDSNLTGSGTSGEPLGLSSTVKLENSLSATKIGPAYVSAANHVGTAYMGPNEVSVNTQVYRETAQLLGGRLTFSNTATSEKVDISSIQRWNSYSASVESARASGSSFGPVSSISETFTGNNWVRREVSDGTSSISSYAFKTVPNVTGFFVLNGNGGWLQVRPSSYSCNVYGLAGSDSVYDWEQTSAYPSGTDYDWRMDFVVHGTGNGYVVVVTDSTAGTTADLHTGESASLFYSHTASAWIGQTGTHSM